MVVCKFFLNGSCKFGDRCRYEHPRNRPGWNQGGGQYYSPQPPRNQGNYGGSFANQNRFAALSGDAQNKGRGPGPGASGPSGGFGDGGNMEPRPGEILESIKRDMGEWDASGMWPYSSYRPTRSSGDIPGFQDLSPEELRLETYLAEKENRFEACKSAISASSAAMRKKREMLAKPSPELKNTLISLYRGQLKAGSLGGQSIFGGQEMLTLDIFIKSGSTLFQSSANSGGFASPPTGLFSSPAPTGTAPSGFGTSTFGSGFGTQSTPTPSSPLHGLFGKPTGSTSTFGSATPAFGSSSGIFGQPTQPQAATPQTTGLFGKPANPPNTAPQGLFGKPVQAGQGLFGKPATPKGAGLFSKPPQATGLFGKPVQPAASSQEWYTPLADLTAEEKEQFEASSFTLGKIPTRPPPVELVNAPA